MKKIIDGMSLETAEYVNPVIEAEIYEIKEKAEVGTAKKKSFKVVSVNDVLFKGIVVSNDRRIKIVNRYIEGTDAEIEYIIDTCTCQENDTIKTVINIISNGGEISIPVEIEVESFGISTEGGNLKNLFHFANLVQIDYQEAVSLFKSKTFKKQFLANDMRLAAVYDGLCRGTDIHTAMEEFLIAANKKEAVKISLSKTEMSYKDIEQDQGDKITITKNTWGYADITVNIYGDFIGVDKRKLTNEDFAGNNYEFAYYVIKEKLHRGNNFGKIEFKTDKQTCVFYVDVIQNVMENTHKDYKDALVKITDTYLDFRFRNIKYDEWINKTNDVLNRIRMKNDTVFFKLLQAQLYVSMGKNTDALWILKNEVSFDELNEDNMELYCFSQYIYTMINREDEFIDEVTNEINGYFENGYDLTGVLWCLFYLDESYNNNASLKIARIKGLYGKNKRSPVMYFEALKAFNEVPQMLRVLEEFEIALLHYGVKKKCISKKLAEVISTLTVSVRQFDKRFFEVLTYIYEKYETDEILVSICRMLIRTNQTDKKYFKWFDMAVQKGMKITSLYEYYMYTADEDANIDIPQIVMMYFAYNTSLLPDEKIDMLYAKIIKNKENLEGIYDTYRPYMEKRIIHYLNKGYIDKNGKTVCEDILSKVMINKEMCNLLPAVLNTYEIECDEDVREVAVIHKELAEETRYPVRNNKAYVNIYTEDECILFINMNQNRYYATKNIKKNKLLHMDEYMELCYEMATYTTPVVLFYANKYLAYKKNQDKSVTLLKHILEMPDIKDDYKKYVEKQIVEFYSKEFDGDSLDEYLESVDVIGLSAGTRDMIIEQSILRGLYERAYKLMNMFGFYNIKPGILMRCVSRLIEKKGFEEDGNITDMAIYVFSKRKYNETVLEYLCRYYVGTTKELTEIWEAVKNFECESIELEKRIILQMIFTNIYTKKGDDIFESFYEKGLERSIAGLYLMKKSYDYFVKEHMASDKFFGFIRDEIKYNTESVEDICKIAYVRYVSEKEEPDIMELYKCEEYIKALSMKGILFECFRMFEKYFVLPENIEDRICVEYRTNPENKVFISYRMLRDDEECEFETKEMKQSYAGVFTYPFLLFYGESIQYYITVTEDTKKHVTESKTIYLTDIEFEKTKTHYGYINDILICKELGEEKTFENIAKDYLVKKELTEIVFGIRKS